jgi:hypothetical protein
MADKTGALADSEALAALRWHWGRAWDIGGCGARWRAARRDGAAVLTRASAAGLDFALQISYGRPR